MTTKAVIFDFDGVIADTERLHYEAFLKCFKTLNISFSWEQYCQRYLHYGDAEFFTVVASDHGVTLSEDEVVAFKAQKATYFAASTEGTGTPLFEGIPELLTGLREAGVVIGLCSSGSRPEILPVLTGNGIDHFFETVVTIEDVVSGKPSPEGYLLAFENMQTTSESPLSTDATIAIEDSPGGLAAARAAGLGAVGICSSYPPEILEDAHWVFASVKSLGTEKLLSLFSSGTHP